MNKYHYSIILSLLLLVSGRSIGQSFINASYDYGVKATNVATNDMAEVYASWKNSFLEPCVNDRFRVKFDDPNFTVSEGIAYGMLLSAYANDQDVFDGLWNYYQDNSNANGVMNWKIEGCNTVNGNNGATDAELDAAYALIVADKSWGNGGAINYEAAAKTLIKAVKDHEVESGSHVLKPGDAWGGSNNTNPSYFTTGYFRAFGVYTSDISFWDAVASKCYATINDNLSKNNAVYNLVSDWTKADGNYSTEVPWAHDQGRSYFYDAARTPWRAAIDYVWYGNNDALSYSSLCNNFVNSVGGFNQIYPGYKQDGTPINTGYKDPTFTGAYALAAMASGDQNFVNAGYTELKNQATTAYFGATLRAIYMFGLSGNLYNALLPQTLSSNKFKNNNTIIKLFPNPANSSVSLSFKTNENHNISIYDINGRNLYNTIVKGDLAEINISDYTNGIYLVVVDNKTLKLVKN